MRQVFADTAALVAFDNRQDAWHAKAVAVSRRLTLAGCCFVTTDAILLEVGNTLSRAQFKTVALRLIETVRRSSHWQCLPVDRPLLDRGLALFRQRPDTDWSLTDCISILVAADLGIEHAFTTDRHFTQAGLEIPLGEQA